METAFASFIRLPKVVMLFNFIVIETMPQHALIDTQQDYTLNHLIQQNNRKGSQFKLQ